MKNCPECGAILADNDLYCENCGFDPDFDVGSWDYGQPDHSRIHYTHRKPTKNPDPYVFGKESFSLLLIVMFAVFLLLFLFRFVLKLL